MADLDFHEFGSDEAEGRDYPVPSGRIGRLVNLIGAAMSLALVAGLGLWGYQLLVRDVTGVPVIRAIQGPMRVQPDEPGGDRAAHQGLAVNRIAAVGEAAPPPDQIVLAPRSADLEAEDLAQGVLRTTPAFAAAPPPRAVPAPSDPLETAILAATTQVMAVEAELSGDGLIEIVPASAPGPARSLRPRLRPEGFATTAAAAAALATAPAGAEATAGEIDPAGLAEGTNLVQFGAYDSAAEARDAWAALAVRFGALMAEKNRMIEPATAGGRSFFRLRAVGFADAAEARRFCAAFVAERADCIPVVAR